jgi:hypothetical protein
LFDADDAPAPLGNRRYRGTAIIPGRREAPRIQAAGITRIAEKKQGFQWFGDCERAHGVDTRAATGVAPDGMA